MNRKKEKIIIGSFLLLAVLLLLCFKSYVVVDNSMYPTLKQGNRIVVFNAYGLNEILVHRNSIVIVKNRFIKDTSVTTLLKRVIAVPNDTIKFTGDKILVNEKQIKQSISGTQKSITLKKHNFFVLGDNTSYSIDSRSFGPVTNSDIEGIIIFSLGF